MNLGIVYNEKGEMINHRSFIKVVLNPFLRAFGIQIATMCEKGDDGKYVIGRPTVDACPRIPFFEGLRRTRYDLKEGHTLEKRRIVI